MPAWGTKFANSPRQKSVASIDSSSFRIDTFVAKWQMCVFGV